MGDEDARTDAGRGAASIALDQPYDEYPRIEAAFQAFLDGSLNPRGPDSLFDGEDER
jgi:hypothetical protein